MPRYCSMKDIPSPRKSGWCCSMTLGRGSTLITRSNAATMLLTCPRRQTSLPATRRQNIEENARQKNPAGAGAEQSIIDHPRRSAAKAAKAPEAPFAGGEFPPEPEPPLSGRRTVPTLAGATAFATTASPMAATPRQVIAIGRRSKRSELPGALQPIEQQFPRRLPLAAPRASCPSIPPDVRN